MQHCEGADLGGQVERRTDATDTTGSDSFHLPLRVVVADLPAIMIEAIRHMVKQRNDVVLQAEAQGTVDLLQKVQSNTHLVLLGTQSSVMPGICTHLLGEYSDLRIVTVNTTNDHAKIYWLGIHGISLGRLSFETLVNDLQKGIDITR